MASKNRTGVFSLSEVFAKIAETEAADHVSNPELPVVKNTWPGRGSVGAFCGSSAWPARYTYITHSSYAQGYSGTSFSNVNRMDHNSDLTVASTRTALYNCGISTMAFSSPSHGYFSVIEGGAMSHIPSWYRVNFETSGDALHTIATNYGTPGCGRGMNRVDYSNDLASPVIRRTIFPYMFRTEAYSAGFCAMWNCFGPTTIQNADVALMIHVYGVGYTCSSSFAAHKMQFANDNSFLAQKMNSYSGAYVCNQKHGAGTYDCAYISGSGTAITKIIFSTDVSTLAVTTQASSSFINTGHSSNSNYWWLYGGQFPGNSSINTSVRRLTYASDTSALSARTTSSPINCHQQASDDRDNYAWQTGGSCNSYFSRYTYANDLSALTQRGTNGMPQPSAPNIARAF